MSSLLKLLSAWRSDPQVGGNFIHWHTTPPQAAAEAPIPGELSPALAQALRSTGVTHLYTHQSATWELASRGKNIILVTGTASGKSLAYNLPVLDGLLRRPGSTALYLFPTKALTQDQHTSLGNLLHLARQFGATGLTPEQLAIYDGDTPASSRSLIRQRARLLFSNPDMLHLGILPHHTRWADFFRGLQYITLDEAHIYRGVFGSHVANLLRRLARITAFYGARPQYFLTSATIGNPLQFAGQLVEADFSLLDQDGSPHGPRHFVFYNPPVVNEGLGLRRSALAEATRLASDLNTYQVQSIVFARTRRSVELALAGLQSQAATENTGEIRGYRSGYLPLDRRKIERGLRQGQVATVVATNALELGIDIGRMDASVLVGYPGSIASIYQQAGRAGRGSDPALALFIATADPLDQYITRHPEFIFDRSPENALIAPNNLLILLNHLRCAAFELPFRQGEAYGRVPASQVQEILDYLVQAGDLHASGGRYFWIADAYPAQSVSLRSASPNTIALQMESPGERQQVIGTIDWDSALWMVHPQAVYLHAGQSYLVESLDLEHNLARLSAQQLDYYTEPRRETTVTVVQEFEQQLIIGASESYGEIDVTQRVVGFRRLRWHTREEIGAGTLDLPPSLLRTTAMWISLADATVDSLRQQQLWNNDSNNYGADWPRQKAAARARDSYTCQVCGLVESGRAHHVHHKTPFRLFSSAAAANHLSNLITLCPACHQRAEQAVRVRSGLAGLGYVLGGLAPLFLMCAPGDLGVHSDPHSPISGGQPIVLIYDQVPAGIGLSQHLYEVHAELLERAYQLVAECPCPDGCPSCVGPGGENGLGGKPETLALLNLLTQL